jgi:hypothetical protein
MALNPKGKYLIQDDSGQIYPWSKALAKRKDMKPYNVNTNKAINDLAAPDAPPKTSIELQGKTFFVNEELHETLVGLLEYVELLKKENEGLKSGFYSKIEKKEVNPHDPNIAAQIRAETDKADYEELLTAKAKESQSKQRKKPGPKPKH